MSEADRVGCLYRLTSPSGKQYVGITVRSAEARWKDHVKMARRGVRSRLASAILCYGPESFRRETLLTASWDYLNWIEPRAIQALGTLWPAGYNLRHGGSQSLMHADSRRRMSEAKKGRPYTDAHRAAHREAMNRPEVREKCSAAKRGTRHSMETRRRMSEAQKRRARCV